MNTYQKSKLAKERNLEVVFGKPLLEIFKECAKTQSFTSTCKHLGLSPKSYFEYKPLFKKHLRSPAATQSIKIANKARTKRYLPNGTLNQAGLTCKEWAEYYGVSVGSVSQRVAKGKPVVATLEVQAEPTTTKQEVALWNLALFGHATNKLLGCTRHR